MKILRSKGAFRGWTRVLIAIPSYAEISPETSYSLFGAKEALITNKIESEIEILTEGCHIDDNRNMIVRDFLESKCDQLIFIDSDVRFDPEDLVKLVKYPYGVVAGIYPKKTEKQEYPVRTLPGEIWSNQLGLIEVESVPTGFLKIDRIVLEKLYTSCQKYTTQKEPYHEKLIPLIFERYTQGDVRLGGDYEFCRKWRKIGGKIYIDPNMRFGHIGRHEFGGILANHLYRENGLIEDHIVKNLRKISEKTASVTDYVQLWDAWGNKWAAPIEMQVTLAEISAKTVLEYGSGLSTLIMGASGKIVTSLENNNHWYDRVTGILGKCRNGGFVRQECSVVKTEIKNGEYNIPVNEEYDCIVLDGPAQSDSNRLFKIPKAKTLVVDDVSSKIVNYYSQYQFRPYGRFAVGTMKKECA